MLHARKLHKWSAEGLLILVLILFLAACGPSAPQETTSTPDVSAVQTPAVPSPSETVPDQEDPSPSGSPAAPEMSAEVSSSPPPEPSPTKTASVPYSEDALEDKLTDILDSIITEEMTKREQARAVFKYVKDHVRFIGNSDKSDWQKGAYEGLTLGRGDCFTFYAASRALLTALDIDNLEVRRTGGTSDHYWNLVNCGDGWYHFDTCPRRVKMDGFDGFMFTDETAAAYSAMRDDIPCYYSFDSSLYPERAGSSTPAESSSPAPSAASDTPSPEPPRPTPTATPLPAPTLSPVPTPSEPPAPEVTPAPDEGPEIPGGETGLTIPDEETLSPSEEPVPSGGEADEGPLFLPSSPPQESSPQAS